MRTFLTMLTRFSSCRWNRVIVRSTPALHAAAAAAIFMNKHHEELEREHGGTGLDGWDPTSSHVLRIVRAQSWYPFS